MQLGSREREIVQMLSEDSTKSVTEISEVLGVSAVTIRRDLKGLCDKGVLMRTHGGAFPSFHPSILERQKQMVAEKERIAKAAAALVEDGDRIMIVAGTTTPLVAKYLLGKRDVHIVTNSTLIYPYARVNPSLHLTVAGGEFRPAAEAHVGPTTVQDFRQFNVDKAFLGTDGFSIERGVTANAVEMAEIVKVAAEQSDRCILLADSSKFGGAGFAQIMGLEKMDGLITDEGMTAETAARLDEFGLSVTRV